MDKFARALEPVALGILLVGGFGMMVSTLLGAADVVGTQFFGRPVHGALEITESTMVVIVFGALTYAQIRRNHIRVELFYTHAGPRLQAFMDLFSHLMAILFFSLLAWQAFHEAILIRGWIASKRVNEAEEEAKSNCCKCDASPIFSIVPAIFLFLLSKVDAQVC